MLLEKEENLILILTLLAKKAFFGGLNYTINNKVNLKAEYDPTITPGLVGYEEPATNINVAIDFKVSNTVQSSVSFERGNYIGVKFIFTDNVKPEILIPTATKRLILIPN